MTTSYKALIIDDEPTAREILELHLSKIDTIDVVGCCSSATDAFSYLTNESVDLLFLDIQMPHLSGLQLAKTIGPSTKIIFTTAHREYAVEGFELQAIDYLLKPISLQRLLSAVNLFLAAQSRHALHQAIADFIFIKVERRMVKLFLSDILYAESKGDYMQLHTQDKSYLTRETMQQLLDKLSSQTFLRIHRSFVVAIPKIDSFTTEQVTILRKALPISRTYKEEVLQTLRQWA